jgi:hypothetical protein
MKIEGKAQLALGEHAGKKHTRVVSSAEPFQAIWAAVSKLNNTAAPQAAGYILQLERALYHLAKADAGAFVAVEHIDDVAVLKGGRPTLQEQDKNSVRQGAELLGDRSKALWRTLQIWLTQRADEGFATCERYLLLSNRRSNTPIAVLLKRPAGEPSKSAEVVAALRAVGASRSKSKVQDIIVDVLSYTDAELTAIIDRIEVVDTTDPTITRLEVANGLAIDSRADAGIILDGLLGWLTRLLREAWQRQEPGLISREACVRQCRELERSQARRRFLPRPAREVPIPAAARDNAMARPFVEHLGRIEAEDDEVYQAVEHFIQFNTEKHRLAAEGDVADHEWKDRGDRLQQRWKNLMRQISREHNGDRAKDVGHRVLAMSTYDHLEPLGGQRCDELYMTAGHYHRLADEDEVWWDPTFRRADS